MRHLLALASLLAVLSVVAAAQTITATPATMNFQRRLVRPERTHILTFRIYDPQLNGTVRWAEQIGSVVTRNGVFSAVLGKG